MRHLILDFETFDPQMKRFGSGFAFKYNYPSYTFDVLGVAYITSNGEEGYTDDWGKLQTLLDTHDSLVMHTANQYDLGCLMVLSKQGHIKFDIRQHFKYDTLILAKLHNQNFYSYSLDILGKIFFRTPKKSDLLHDWAWSTGLYQQNKYEQTKRHVHTRPSDKVMETWCKQNMNLFPIEVISEYAIGDVQLTKRLFEKLLPLVEEQDLEMYSDLQNICVSAKVKGICVDMEFTRTTSDEFGKDVEDLEQKVYKILGHEINLNSAKQLAPLLIKYGYDVPMTDKGNPSIKTEWLEEQQGDVAQALIDYKAAVKAKTSFVDKLIKYQEAIPEEYRDSKVGRFFPTMKILGATTTGRFSSGGGTGCFEFNMQNQPVRNPKYGKPIRKMYIPFPNEQWGYGDFSSQESRLQVHYAKLLSCKGIQGIVDDWNADPNMSFHDKVAEIAGIDRASAKDINLGLSYGMGEEKLLISLGTDSEIGLAILKQYHEMVPFMKQLRSITSKAIKQNGYVRTIGGVKLRIGKEQGAEKDGLSKTIQGSAACQCKKSLQRAWHKGILILFWVHDEFNWSSSNIDEELPIVQECMEGAYELVVPVVAEMGSGQNWLEAKGG